MTERLKVLMIIRRFPPQSFGGGELSAYTLAKHLVEKGCEITVLTGKWDGFKGVDRVCNDLKTQDPKAHESMGYMDVRRVIPVPKAQHSELVWNKNTLKCLNDDPQGDYDIIHVHDPRLITAGLEYGKRIKRPVLATINDLNKTCYYSLHYRNHNLCKRCSLRGLYTCMRAWRGNVLAIPYIYGRVRFKNIRELNALSGILCRSSDVMAILRANNVRVPMIVNPPAVEKIGPAGQPPSSKRILYIGRVDRGKGIEVVINALPSLRDWRFRVVGTGPYLEVYRNMARDLGVEDRVEFVGSKLHNMILEELSKSDLTALPSTRVEPMPRIIFESLMAGRGIIVSQLTGGREYITSGRNGYVIPYGDVKSMAEAFTVGVNKLERVGVEKVGSEGRALIERLYSLDSIVNDVLAFYKSILNKG